MWEMLGIIHRRRFPEITRMIDPACGEGVFLCAAADRGLAATGLFGADIDEMLAWKRGAELHIMLRAQPNLGISIPVWWS